jgi:hypothetical protein
LNKIVLEKNISAIFLVTVLVAGTIATFSPSFMVGAQADSYLEMENNYEKSYGNYNIDKSKDSSSVSIKKVKCNNINVNVNGLELNTTSVPSLSNLLASEAQAEDEGERDTGSYGSNDGIYGSGQSGHDNNSFKFVCINNNNNTVIEEEEPTTGTLKVTKQITCDDSSALEGDCEELLELLTEDQFTFQVEGNNPDPSSTFPGSPAGTDVTLGPGDYVVTETIEESVFDDVFTFFENNPDRFFIVVIDHSFTGDCNFLDFSGTEVRATGTIAAGESQTCNAINAFTINSEPITPD